MTPNREKQSPTRRAAGLAVAAAIFAATVHVLVQTGLAAEDAKVASAEKQRQLIAVLQSDAPPQDKAISCKLLAIHGTSDAVPVLAPLLADDRLASWARIALEVIPGPVADGALREAMGKLQGRLLIGVINSIGTRRDAQAVSGLLGKLKDADVEVAAAAATALGHIGGAAAAKALEQALAGAAAGLRPAVAEGCLLCAEQDLAQGNFTSATALYDRVRNADVPKQKMLEATRGAILARRSAGIPLLIEQLRSDDWARCGIGLRTARELPGQNVTEALAAELDRSSSERQPMLLLALADRSDAAALPAVIKAAQPGSKNLRFAAIAALERFNPVAGVPTLVEAATDNDPAIAQTAKGVLTRMPSQEVDTDLLSRLLQASGKLRQVLIEIAAQRRIDRALPSIVLASADPDAGIRAAAVNAIGLLGDNKEVGVLVKLLQRNPPTQERADLEKALVAVCGRCGSDCAAHLAPLAQSEDAALRLIAIHAFASMGGPVALAAVKNAADDKDETVQDEAVRTLSTWPSNWPEDVAVAETLLALARSGKKMSHQVLGLRGYLQFVQGDKQLKDDQKVTKIGELLPLIKRPEEKRLAINVIGTLPTASAVEWLLSLTDDPTIAEDAYAAIVTLGAKNVAGMTVEQRRQTLQSILDKSSTDATKKKAQDALNRIR